MVGNAETESNLVTEFRDLAETVAGRLVACGLETKPYADPSVSSYSALTPEVQKSRLENLRVYLQTIEMAEKSGDRFEDSRSIWHGLSALGLVPPSDLFAKLPPDSAIEVYDLQGIQIWRNWETMRVCSYTLEEIFSLEWHRRYDRDERITAQCFQAVMEVMSGQKGEILDPEIPTHFLLETCSQERFLLNIKFRLIARLKDRDGNPAGFLVASSVISARKTKELDLSSLKDERILTLV